eukprot:757648-Pelagomonas_calceolata.AAC.3
MMGEGTVESLAARAGRGVHVCGVDRMKEGLEQGCCAGGAVQGVDAAAAAAACGVALAGNTEVVCLAAGLAPPEASVARGVGEVEDLPAEGCGEGCTQGAAAACGAAPRANAGACGVGCAPAGCGKGTGLPAAAAAAAAAAAVSEYFGHGWAGPFLWPSGVKRGIHVRSAEWVHVVAAAHGAVVQSAALRRKAAQKHQQRHRERLRLGPQGDGMGSLGAQHHHCPPAALRAAASTGSVHAPGAPGQQLVTSGGSAGWCTAAFFVETLLRPPASSCAQALTQTGQRSRASVREARKERARKECVL